jgi:hypothetical protein
MTILVFPQDGWLAESDGDDFGARVSDFVIMFSHLDQMRLALDSRQVPQENQ